MSPGSSAPTIMTWDRLPRATQPSTKRVPAAGLAGAVVLDAGEVAQHEALHLAGRGAWQRGEEDDALRPLEARQPLGAGALHALAHGLLLAGRGYDVGDELRQTALAGATDRRAVAHPGDGRDDALDLERRDPLAGHLEHVVGAAEEAEGAVRLLERLVAGHEPLAAEGATRRLGALPVAGGDAAAADAQLADLARRHRRAALVHHLHLVTGHRPPERSRDAVAGPVREEDVERLGGPEPVEDLVAEALLPREEDRLGQRLARRDEPAEPRDRLLRPGRSMIQERVVDRRHGEEEARPLLGEDLPGPRPREGLRREHDRGARGEREVEAGAEAVGEEELRGRVGDVVGAQFEDVAPVALDRVQDAPLHVDDALRAAGGPRAVEPERGVVGIGGERLPRGRLALDLPPETPAPPRPDGEHRRGEPREPHLRLEHLGHGFARDHGPRARLAHERKVIGGPEEAADQDRHRPGPDRAEERVYVLGTVGKDDEDALLLLDPEPPEGGGPLADALAERAAAHVEAVGLRAQAERDGSIVAAAQDLRGDVDGGDLVDGGQPASYCSL